MVMSVLGVISMREVPLCSAGWQIESRVGGRRGLGGGGRDVWHVMVARAVVCVLRAAEA